MGKVRSDEREALAEAIVRVNGLKDELETTVRAIDETSEQIWQQTKVVTKLEESVGEAKQLSVQHRVATSLGKKQTKPKTVKQVQAELEDAEEELSELMASRELLHTSKAETEQQLSFATVALRNAIKEVVRASDVSAFVKQFHDAHREFVNYRRALQFLVGGDYIDKKYEFALSEHDWPDLDMAAQWHDAIKQLEQDADAELPL